MELHEFLKRDTFDPARRAGLLAQAKKSPELKHINMDRVEAIVARSHIHLDRAFQERPLWWSGQVLDDTDKIHRVQLTYYRNDFTRPDGAWCFTCKCYCEALVAAVIWHLSFKDPPDLDKDKPLIRCPICSSLL